MSPNYLRGVETDIVISVKAEKFTDVSGDWINKN